MGMTVVAQIARKGTKGLTLSQREAVACFLFIAPAVLGFILFAAIPLLISAYISLTNYALAGWPRFVGFRNYLELFNDEFFWQSVKVTSRYALFVVPLWLVNSLLLALMMNQRIKGTTIFRTIYYLPAVVSGVAISMLWIWIFNYRAGLINMALKAIHIQGPNWLGDPGIALNALIIMSQWSVGWYLPIWLGGLQSIPTELYEAAEIDGAGDWAKTLHVTLPMLSPVILYNLVMNIIWALQLFTEAFVMTGGGPRFATLSYVLYLYNNAFGYGKMGHASAMAWILFLVTVLLTALVFRSTPMWVYYESERRN